MMNYKSQLHIFARNNTQWVANSRHPVKTYLIKDLTDQHICNILANCHHLPVRYRRMFYTELEGRFDGYFERKIEAGAVVYT